MEHESHISDEPGIGMGARIIAVVAILAALCGIGAYVVYGSGMWNPPVQQSRY